MVEPALSDASPIIGLARVDGLPWLPALVGDVAVTDDVVREVLADPTRADAQRIQAALDGGLLLRYGPAPAGPELPPGLGRGEASCIRAALGSASPPLLLMDDRLGRRETRRRELRVVGTAALVAAARAADLIPSARDVLERLSASGFRLSPAVIARVLERAGER